MSVYYFPRLLLERCLGLGLGLNVRVTRGVFFGKLLSSFLKKLRLTHLSHHHLHPHLTSLAIFTFLELPSSAQRSLISTPNPQSRGSRSSHPDG